MTIDIKKGEFRAPKSKLGSIVALAKQLLVRAAQNKRWLPVKSLASLSRTAQFLHMAIPVARFYLTELHDVFKAAE
jgi:hypothetical protein